MDRFDAPPIRRRTETHCQRRLFVNKSLGILAICLPSPAVLLAQTLIPDWCRPLPRPEYKNLERVPVSDPWFEVYKPSPNVFAIYEPHQAEEVISYLIVGEKRAVLFDTAWASVTSRRSPRN